MKVRIFRPLTRLLGPGVAGALLAACSEIAAPAGPLFWEGEFQADATAEILISGDAAMVANASDTQAGIGIQAVDAESVVLSWRVRNGACSGSGDRIAPQSTFPDMPAGTSSQRSSNAVIHRRIAGSRPYAVEVFEGAGAAGQRIACADLAERDAL